MSEKRQELEMRDGIPFYRCPRCTQFFRFGAGRYDGKTLQPSGLAVCNACLD